jgi:hypothetical protein
MMRNQITKFWTSAAPFRLGRCHCAGVGDPGFPRADVERAWTAFACLTVIVLAVRQGCLPHGVARPVCAIVRSDGKRCSGKTRLFGSGQRTSKEND